MAGVARGVAGAHVSRATRPRVRGPLLPGLSLELPLHEGTEVGRQLGGGDGDVGHEVGVNRDGDLLQLSTKFHETLQYS